MKPACFTAIILALLLSPASAHPRHRHLNPVAQSLGAGLLFMLQHRNADPQHQWHENWNYPNTIDVPPRGWPLQHSSGNDPRPRAWCGWFMRQRKGIADTSYNLARNWVHYGSPAGGPRVGAVVVWAHHVGEIVSGECPAGEWMVHSGNDGNTVRTRCRSLRGVLAFRI